MAIGTAAMVATATSAFAGTSASEAAPSDDYAAAASRRSGARQLWELSAASSPTSGERADLVSPTVSPQLSPSEKQVAHVLGPARLPQHPLVCSAYS